MCHKKTGSFAALIAMVALQSAMAGDLVASDVVQAKPASKLQGPLKIYILAGQSNMQGQAHKRTIPRMALSPETQALHDKIVDKEGNPRVYENIRVAAFSRDGGYGVAPMDQEKSGPLTVGFGNDLKGTSILGPELAFGITMAEQVGQPILIIKTAWGGKSLNYNFRPPSAGNLYKPYTKKEIEEMKAKYKEQKEKFEKTGKGKEPETVESLITKRESAIKDCGKYYRLMMAHIQKVLADPGKYHPAYNLEQGYEIAGFGWFQGYNDRFFGAPFDFYTQALAHLIRDVRKGLNAPKMLFAIGIIGIEGDGPAADVELRKAQAATAELPEFKGNVVAIPTACFWDSQMRAAIEKVRNADQIWDSSEFWTPLGQGKPEERVWDYTSFQLDEKEQFRPAKPGEQIDERILVGTVPKGMERWMAPDFDTGAWKKGPAPIGKDVRPEKYRNNKVSKEKLTSGEVYQQQIRSPWGEGNMLMMRTVINHEPDVFTRYRLRVKSTGAFLVHLNGQLIKTYPWWKGGTHFRVFDLTDEQAKCLKPGPNVLSFYGNINSEGAGAVNTVDLMLEGITRKQLDDLNKQMDAVRTPRDIGLSKGSSNQGFHYMGSAYTYSLVGEALAKAIADMDAKRK